MRPHRRPAAAAANLGNLATLTARRAGRGAEPPGQLGAGAGAEPAGNLTGSGRLGALQRRGVHGVRPGTADAEAVHRWPHGEFSWAAGFMNRVRQVRIGR